VIHSRIKQLYLSIAGRNQVQPRSFN